MKNEEYLKELGRAPASRLNEITRAVNSKTPKAEAGLKSEFEETFYDRLCAEADAYEKRGGVRPVFDMAEIESDDPRLDIYTTAASDSRHIDTIKEV